MEPGSGMQLSVRSTSLKVRELVAAKRDGKLHLPDLQRGFVWDAERVRMLFDSLYRRYPVGSLLLWKPAWEQAESPVNTRPWGLYPPNSTTEAGQSEPKIEPTPGSIFVLDGQQRLTSLFRVIFDSRLNGSATRDPNLYVSLSSDDDWRDEPFFYKSRQIKKEDERRGLLVPAAVLFAGVRTGDRNGAESLAVSRAIAEWLPPTEPAYFAALDRANQIRNAILNAEIVSYEIDTTASDENVIEIFGRLNQQAIRLTPADLAAARLTGKMKDFRARANTALETDDLRAFALPEGVERSEQGGFVDTDLIVRTAMCLATGIVKYRDAEKIKQGNAELYSQIEPKWDSAVGALKGVVAMFQQAGIPDGSWIPYRYILLTPAVALGSGHTRPADGWLGWAIAASLWGVYAGSAETKVQSDARHAAKGDWDALWQSIKVRAKRRETLIPEAEDLTAGLVQPSGVYLALLVHWARSEGRSFYGYRYASRTKDLDIHHIFPRTLFSGLGKAPKDTSRIPDRLGNLTILTAEDNRSLGAAQPAAYLATLDPEIRQMHCVPETPALWSYDHYAEFCTAREVLLAARIGELLGSLGVR
jgi:hypothetical protein